MNEAIGGTSARWMLYSARLKKYTVEAVIGHERTVIRNVWPCVQYAMHLPFRKYQCLTKTTENKTLMHLQPCRLSDLTLRSRDAFMATRLGALHRGGRRFSND